MPKMRSIMNGKLDAEIEHQAGALSSLPELPPCDAPSTARYIQAVLDGTSPVPPPIALQVEQVARLARSAEIAGVPQ
jgi:hypothetical protein